MPGLRLYLLGPPRLERDGQPVGFDTRKNVALIAYLAVTGTSHTREALVTLLWPELEPSRARAGLRRNLSVIRKALGGDWLEADRERVGTDPEADMWLDAAEFQRLASSWRGHNHPEAEVCPGCMRDLAQAADLYQDHFMAGFSLRDSAAYDEWQFFEGEGLKQQLASTLERLVAGHRAQGEAKEAIPYARRWLALDPLHEPAHRALMVLYASAGQRSAAVRQYEECGRLLEDELGLEPSEETSALYQEIRAGGLAPGAVERPKHNLPAEVTPFVGRHEEMKEIATRLNDPNCRLLTLVGPGGIGKTRLALEAARQVCETGAGGYEHGVYHVRLGPVGSVDGIVPAMAKVIDVPFREEGSPRQQLLNYLSQKRMLLLLDGWEHLSEGVGLVSDLLRTAPGVKVLATSRARLNVQGEYLSQLGGLHYPTEGAEEDAAGCSAVELFLQSACRMQPDFELTADNQGDVVRICELVEGTPLGILLAAAWTEVLTPGEIAAEIARSLDFLAAEMADLPARQRSMRAVFDHSWSLLNERLRSILQALSVFRGGFTRDAARQVADATLHDLKALADRSLIQRGQGARYELHELLRQFAAERLQAAPEAFETAHDRHCGTYMALLERWNHDQRGPNMTAALVQMDEEIENVRAAWAWASKRGQLERLDQGADGLGFYCSVRWRRQEAIAGFQMAATSLADTRHVRALPDGYRRRVLANALVWLAYFHNAGGSYERASQLIEESLSLLDVPEHALPSGDLKPSEDVRHERAFALSVKAQSVAHVDPGMAVQLQEQGLALYRALGDQWRIARQLFYLAYTARHLGDYSKANDLFRKSLEIGKALGDQSGVAFALHGLTSIALRQGEYKESARLVQECIAIRGEIGDRIGVAHELGLSSRVLMALGKYEEAHCTLKEVLEMLDDLGARFGIYPAWWKGWLGFAALHLGRYGQAREQAQLIRAVYQEHSTPWGVAWSLSLLASVALVENDPAVALELLEQGIGLNRGVGQRDRLAADFGLMAFAARERGQLGRAERYLLDACRTAVEIGNQRQLEELLPVLALLSADQGKPERAVELYALAKRYPSVAESWWYEDVAGKHIAAVAAAMPPEMAAAARKRGRGLDLEATLAEYLTDEGAPP